MTYLLGHDAAELARLEHQARMLAPAAAGSLPSTALSAQVTSWVTPAARAGQDRRGDTGRVDIDTLEDRIACDCIDNDVIFKFPTLVGAWARVA